MVKVLIADDQRLLIESFKNIIENNSDIKVIGCVANGKEAYDFCSDTLPDVILMDISMPICNGTEATKRIKAKYPEIKVLILTSSEDEDDINDAIKNGADGYILKDVGVYELILSIQSTAAGLGIMNKDIFNSISIKKDINVKDNSKATVLNMNGSSVTITERELKIIELLVNGNENRQIGQALFIADGTVKNILTEIISKLQLKDRTQLAVYAIKNNLV
jgi:DNA-binding NarL/FixJ family response regulator